MVNLENKAKSPNKKESLSRVMKTTSTKRVVTAGMILTILDILSSIFFTIYNMILDRSLTQDEKSILVTISAYLSMLKTFAMLGFVGAGAKFLSEYLERDKEEARKYGMSASKYNFLLTGVPIIGLSVVIYFFKATTNDPLTITAFFLLIIIVALDRLRTCPDIYLLAYQRYDLYAVSFHFSTGLMYTLAFILMPILGVLGPLISWIIGYSLMNVLSFFFMRKVSDFPARDVFSWRREHGFFTKMLKFNFLYSLANLCYALLTTTLFITMGDILGILTRDEIVALGLISTFSNILLNVFGIVAGIQPAISQAFALKNRKLMKNYFLASLKFPLIMSVAVITFFILFGEEMITIFFPKQDVKLGLFIMSCLMPFYAIVAFASRYDNILAGIGRPETAIIPWFIGIFITLMGFILTSLTIPASATVGFLSARFFTGMLSMIIGLAIPGISIVIISIKVLEIPIPRSFFTRTFITAVITAFIVLFIKIVFPLKAWLNSIFSDSVAGVIYTVLMVIIGVIIYLSVGIIFGVFTRTDGRFWKSVLHTIPGIKYLLIPLFSWSRFLLKHVPRALQVQEINWITTTTRDEMKKDMEFSIEDDFTSHYPNGTINKEKTVAFSITIAGIKQTFYNVLISIKIDMKPINEAIYYKDVMEQDTNIPISFNIPSKFEKGHHEMYISVEMYTKQVNRINEEKLRKKHKLWTYFDFNFKWRDEKIKYIMLS
ncbi:MAG: lipopolysaccharide biosynthesis protein [Promethearchaeota archaeon]